MKKTYINPNMTIVKIAGQTQIMAGSTYSKSGGFGDADTSGGTGTEGFTLNGRESNFWEEEY